MMDNALQAVDRYAPSLSKLIAAWPAGWSEERVRVYAEAWDGLDTAEVARAVGDLIRTADREYAPPPAAVRDMVIGRRGHRSTSDGLPPQWDCIHPAELRRRWNDLRAEMAASREAQHAVWRKARRLEQRGFPVRWEHLSGVSALPPDRAHEYLRQVVAVANERAEEAA